MTPTEAQRLSEQRQAVEQIREGTQILRAGGGAILTAAECRAVIDFIDSLARQLAEAGRENGRLRNFLSYLRPHLANGSIFDRTVLVKDLDAALNPPDPPAPPPKDPEAAADVEGAA